MAIKLHPGERLDDLQLNGLQIIQDPKRFCFGMDAVLLSDFAKVRTGGKGAGSGNRNRDFTHPSCREDKGTAFYRAGDPAGERGDGAPERSL